MLNYLHFILWLQLNSMCSCKDANSVLSQFVLSSNEEFQHLIIHPITGHLYAGATNALYKFDASDTLAVIQRATTGPEMDSPYCNYDGQCIQSPSTSLKSPKMTNKTMTNNYNQILLIHPKWNSLIACGTLKQGTCSVHDMDDISEVAFTESRSVAVAANSKNATTAAFLGPGDDDSFVLYVATSFTFDAYRDAFPAVCTRTLNSASAFQLLDQGDVTGQSGLMIRNEYRSDFRVYYVGGFHLGDYAYWVSVQRKSVVDPGSPFLCKLLRVCVNDLRYETYAELPLECLGADNAQYNVMKDFYIGPLEFRGEKEKQEYLVGVFTKSTDPWKIDNRQRSFQSAVCVFAMKDISEAFVHNLQRCNSGIGKWNLPHFGFDQKCYNVTGKHESFCQPLRLGSEVPVTTAAVITNYGPLLTSISVTPVDGANVLFIGTGNGRLKKIWLNTINSGREYSELVLTESSSSGNGHVSNWLAIGRDDVNPDMVFDLERRHLFVITQTKLMKVAVETCASYETCLSCMASGDPYCGWCTLESRCTRREDCPTSSMKYGFLSSINSDSSSIHACPRIEAIGPLNISIHADWNTDLTLIFNILPPATEAVFYRCLFENGATVAKFLAPRTLMCRVPSSMRSWSVDGGTSSSPLRVWSSATDAVFFEVPVLFFDCGAYKRCTSCVQSSLPCQWCLEKSRCIDNHKDCIADRKSTHYRHGEKRHDKIISHHRTEFLHWRSVNQAMSPLPAARHHLPSALRLDQCPRIDSEELLIPAGQKVAIHLPVANIDRGPSSIVLDPLMCVITVESKVTSVDGWLAEDGKVVVCDKHKFNYDAKNKSIMERLQLQTADGVIIDQTQVRLYKCEALGPDCTRCRKLDHHYQCQWCNDRCQYKESCIGMNLSFNSVQRCPPPAIISVVPSAGPVEGGTMLEIRGTDMGVRKEDVEVTLAGRVLCDVVEYTLAEKVICRTRAVNGEMKGPVQIRLLSTWATVGLSQAQFRYVRLSLDDVHPRVGPKSGGTKVVLSGKHLLDGSVVQVFVGPFPCIIEKWASTSDHVICKTTSVTLSTDRSIVHSLTVVVDHCNRTFPIQFDFTPDPRILSVEPSISFQSGGRQLVVRGDYLDSVQKPLMFLIDPITGYVASENSICQIINSTVILCPSPILLPSQGNRLRRREIKKGLSADNIKTVLHTRREQHLIRVTDPSPFAQYIVGFAMDAVEAVKRLDEIIFTVVPDPSYFPFPHGRKVANKGDMLVLEGRNLNLSSNENEVRVNIGQQRCKIFLLSSTQLVCQLPEFSREDNSITGYPEASVSVRMGYLEFILGTLSVQPESRSMLLADSDASGWDMGLVGAIIGGCTMLMAAVSAVFIFWWQRNIRQNDTVYSPVRSQMDFLEYWNRQGCKTDTKTGEDIENTECGSDLYTGSVPYHDRATFARNMLFHSTNYEKPNDMERTGEHHKEKWSTDIGDFERLLENDSFITSLIDGYEQQFVDPNECTYVAGLISIILAKDMPRFTKLISTIVQHEIGRNDNGMKDQCYFTFWKGSVSQAIVANWVALCCYDYIVECGHGNALFQLCKALRCQVEQGPVDAITGRAQFALSEEYLLQEEIEFEPLLLSVIPPTIISNMAETVPCRVLTCDTVKQMKEKVMDAIYQNIPFSKRISIHDVELEWRCERSNRRIILQEHAYTVSGSSGECWYRMKMIGDYGVQMNDVVAVCLKAGTGCVETDGSMHTYTSISSSTHLLSSSSLSSDTSGDRSSYSRPKGCSKFIIGKTPVPQGPHVDLPAKVWHLAKPVRSPTSSISGGLITEERFKRLLAAKATLQRNIDHVFTWLLSVGTAPFPLAVKYLFDLFIKEASASNCGHGASSWIIDIYFLTFWRQLVRKPEFLLDMDESPSVSSSTRLLSEILLLICTSNNEETENESSNLFSNDIERYREMLKQFLGEIRKMPAVNEQELILELRTLSKAYMNELEAGRGEVQGLLKIVHKYRLKFLDAVSSSVTSGENEAGYLQQRQE